MVVLFLLFLSSLTWAHQTSLTPAGKELFWSNPQVPMVIRTNTSDMASHQVISIIQQSMNQWNLSTSAKINSVASSINEIKFVPDFVHGSAVIGMTELTYNSAGAIQSAVISLNDDYQFMASPGLYSAGKVYLGDVTTHEFGHLFGLSHSEVLNSSMFYASFSGQNTLSKDDQAGIRTKYDSEYGSISGYVKGGSNIGVLGAHVQAISRTTGEASGIVTDETGYFSLGGLDLNDTYYLYVSPIKNADSLPGYFSNIQKDFCPAAYVGSFFTACGRNFDGKPHGINLTYQLPDVDVGTVTINCSLRADQEYSGHKLESEFSPITIYDFALEQKHEKAFVGWFRKPSTTSWSKYDRLNVDLTGFMEVTHTANKYLKIALVSYPLGSQLEYEMTVKMNGTLLPSAARNMTYVEESETYQTDFHSLIPLSSNNNANYFELGIRSRLLSGSYLAQTFPASSQFSSDSYLPYLVVASLWEQTPQGLNPLMDNGVILSDNISCLDAPFTYTVTKARTVSDSPVSAAGATATAACGTIDPPDQGPGGSLPLLMLGFLLALLSSSLLNLRKKFLS